MGGATAFPDSLRLRKIPFVVALFYRVRLANIAGLGVPICPSDTLQARLSSNFK